MARVFVPERVCLIKHTSSKGDAARTDANDMACVLVPERVCVIKHTSREKITHTHNLYRS